MCRRINGGGDARKASEETNWLARFWDTTKNRWTLVKEEKQEDKFLFSRKGSILDEIIGASAATVGLLARLSHCPVLAEQLEKDLLQENPLLAGDSRLRALVHTAS